MEDAMSQEKTLDKKEKVMAKFTEAAAEIIKTEGYNALTVRKVAERTEYSYPAMYHYFNDLDHLYALSKALLIRQTVDEILLRLHSDNVRQDDLYGVFRIYTLYYFENPNLFRFFNDKAIPRKYLSLIYENTPDFNSLWRTSFTKQVALGRCKVEEIDLLAKTIIYSIHGMIALALSNSGDLNEETIVDQLYSIMDYLLRKA
ncbi:MAG TPA: hypothetical protein DCP62_03690 [Erysipelotrichaceae bacterium]|nr:hypothetical protein [Erysipelotrichaceae bacterium]HBZ42348.1 hypothetical protein [Erysipelotrichaceae bacterium]